MIRSKWVAFFLFVWVASTPLFYSEASAEVSEWRAPWKKKKKKKIKAPQSLAMDPVVREEPVEGMSASVIIPCVAKHFSCLRPLLQAYEDQTEPPDEVIVSLSESELVAPLDILALEAEPWSFDLTILQQEGKQSAGFNRNAAAEEATGDIILCQDADDWPHPQRVEIVKYFFKYYEIDHLMHQWKWEEEEFPTYRDPAIIPISRYESYDAVKQDLPTRGIQVHNGNACMARHVVDNILWNEEFISYQDVLFSEDVYRQYKNNVILEATLLTYRQYLSSFQ
ncbi:MAG: glycosyltransferase family 2 protein [Verrucomicrobiota bacterium]|nr:glycosyltransferase family 2 protein [Verrucomicrobiota bacterium]